MREENIKITLLATIVTAVLCAGTVSARQLRSLKVQPPVAAAAARIQPCPEFGCICVFPLESTTGFCSTHPTGVQPPAK